MHTANFFKLESRKKVSLCRCLTWVQFQGLSSGYEVVAQVLILFPYQVFEMIAVLVI